MVEMFDAEEETKSERDDPKLMNLQNQSFRNFSTPESEDRVLGSFGPIELSYLRPINLV